MVRVEDLQSSQLTETRGMSLALVVQLGTDCKIENNIIVVRQNSLYQIIAPGEGVSSSLPSPISYLYPPTYTYTAPPIAIERKVMVEIGLHLLG